MKSNYRMDFRSYCQPRLCVYNQMNSFEASKEVVHGARPPIFSFYTKKNELAKFTLKKIKLRSPSPQEAAKEPTAAASELIGNNVNYYGRCNKHHATVLHA